MFLRSAIVVIILIVVGYGLKEALPLALGPQITLTSPKSGEIFYKEFIPISGVALHTQSVSLNGGPLVTDQYGHFSTILTLPRGGAILTITATDRFGRTKTEQRDVVVP